MQLHPCQFRGARCRIAIIVALATVLGGGCSGVSRSLPSTAWASDWWPSVERLTDVCHGPRRLQRRVVGEPYQIGARWFYPAHDPDFVEVGTSAWYGAKFHGRRTASGERFDMNAMTVAHPTLPMPSLISVRNIENGRTVTLRVNDRGPFNAGRVLDVSRAAARALGFERDGLAEVEIVYNGPAPLREITTCRA